MPSEQKVNKRVLFIVPAPRGISPGQRFRFEHYLDYLETYGISYQLSPYYTMNGWMTLFGRGHHLKKLLIVLRGFAVRFRDLFHLSSFDFVYIYREATPLGPPWFEMIITKLLKKKVIYDFDDAIWIPASSEYNRLAYSFKWFSKIAKICKWSYTITVGNDYLASFARQYNESIVVIPTVVDTALTHNKIQSQDTQHPVIGWTGTFSTLKYLELIIPVLQNLQETFEFKFIVIANKDPDLPLKNYEFIKWTKNTETADLLKMHIGLMPLFDDDYSRGKCGFKAIQYMALGIPAVVSAVGVNPVIVNDTNDGFVCTTNAQWGQRLITLLTDKELRIRMGIAAQKKIVNAYSVEATRKIFIDLFQ